jgi:hypothetical protein
MINDDRFDEVLQEAAREHNSAPATPRAEMWAAITAARGRASPDAGGARTRVERDEKPAVRVLPFTARHRRTFAFVAGLAATLLIGIVIGRQGRTPSVTPTVGRDIGMTTSAPTNVASSEPTNGGTGPVIPSPVPPSVALGGARGTRMPNGGVPAVGVAAHAPRPTAGARAGSTEAEAMTPYRVATMQHLVATEALLVALRTDTRTGRSDTTIATWAGDLLGTTRLLIDSPAAKDPQLKQLLEDLELVLAQISRLPGAHGEAADLGIIDDAVRHRQIITRLRALSPET